MRIVVALLWAATPALAAPALIAECNVAAPAATEACVRNALLLDGAVSLHTPGLQSARETALASEAFPDIEFWRELDIRWLRYSFAHAGVGEALRKLKGDFARGEGRMAGSGECAWVRSAAASAPEGVVILHSCRHVGVGAGAVAGLCNGMLDFVSPH